MSNEVMGVPFVSWWMALSQETRAWFAAHIGETLPAEVVADVYKQTGHLVGWPEGDASSFSAKPFALSPHVWVEIRENLGL